MYKMLYHINKFADIAGSIMKMSEMVITLIQHNYQVFSLGKCVNDISIKTGLSCTCSIGAKFIYLVG